MVYKMYVVQSVWILDLGSSLSIKHAAIAISGLIGELMGNDPQKGSGIFAEYNFGKKIYQTYVTYTEFNVRNINGNSSILLNLPYKLISDQYFNPLLWNWNLPKKIKKWPQFPFGVDQ